MPYMQLDPIREEITRIQEYDDELLDLVNVPTNQLPDAYQLHEHFELLLRKLERRADDLKAGAAAKAEETESGPA